MDVCSINSSTAEKIRMPPIICIEASFSPRKKKANNEAATVSELDAIDAPVGLTRRSPSKKIENGIRVELNENNRARLQRCSAVTALTVVMGF